MIARLTRLCVVVGPLLLLSLSFAALGAGSVVRGESVADVLSRARDEGLTIIFSTQLVPPDLKVLEEPVAPGGIERLNEVLAPHGLRLSKVADNVYAVVARESAPTPPAKDVAGPDDRARAAAAQTATLGSVVVSTSRYSLASEYGASAVMLTQEQIQNLPRLGDETLRAVQRLPGVTTNGFSGLGAIRGGEPGETLIILDGLPLYEPFHLKDFLGPVSLLDSRVVATMDVYSGGFPVEYGDRMSGVIDAHSLEPPAERYYELGLSLFHASALTAGTWGDGRGRWLVSARRSNLGEVAHVVEADFGEPRYFDSRVRFEYALSDSTRVALNGLASRDTLKADSSGGEERTEVEYRNGYVWANVDHDWSESAHTGLVVSFTDVRNEREGAAEEPEERSGNVDDDRSFHVAGLRLRHTILHGGSVYALGAESRYLTAHYRYASRIRFEADFPFPGDPARETVINLSPDPEGWQHAAFASGRWSLSPRLTAELGLRWDEQTYGADDREQVAPRASVKYDLGDTSIVRASYGRFYQAQGINELQVEDGIDSFFGAQRADHAIVSFEQALRPDWRVRVEAYRKDYAHLRPRIEALFDPLALLPDLAPDRVRIAPTGADVEGVELLVSRQSEGSWNGWLSYGWSRAVDRVDGRDELRSWDQTHSIGAGLTWSRGPWNVTVTDTYHTGWPTTGVRLVTAPGGEATVEIGPRNEQRLEPFNSLDARASRRFPLPRGDLEVYVEVSNLTDNSNPCCTEYSVETQPDGSAVLVRNESDWLGIVPSFGVLWRY